MKSKEQPGTHLPIKSLLFKSVPLLKSKFRHSTFLWGQKIEITSSVYYETGTTNTLLQPDCWTYNWF